MFPKGTPNLNSAPRKSNSNHGQGRGSWAWGQAGGGGGEGPGGAGRADGSQESRAQLPTTTSPRPGRATALATTQEVGPSRRRSLRPGWSLTPERSLSDVAQPQLPQNLLEPWENTDPPPPWLPVLKPGREAHRE